MGIIVNDDVTIDVDQSLVIRSSYVNVHTVIITKNELYELCYKYQIYFNHEARINNKNPLKTILVSKELSELPSDIYKFIYDEIKVLYDGYTDV